jgi:regulator of cell morphogenesis and NO signaling
MVGPPRNEEEDIADVSLAAVLEREHHAIDSGIELLASGSQRGGVEPLRRAIAVLRRHIYVEEERIFPTLREQGMFGPLLVMLREHGQLWDTIDRIERDLDTGAPDLAHTCHQLLVQLQHHNVKEERIMYPQADQALEPPEAAELITFLRGGELPTGWTCAQATVNR